MRQDPVNFDDLPVAKLMTYQIFNDLLDSGHDQDEEKRHQGGPATSGRHIGDLLRERPRWEVQS